jgi:ABC-type branched-subunit amino acid transport system substrate-binding protein
VGVAADHLTVSVIAAFSGPYGVVVEQSYDGFQLGIDEMNAHGGFHGRRVETKKVDHKESSGGGVAACKEVLSNGSFFAMIIEGQGDANVTAADCLDKAGFPNLAFLSQADPTWRNTFTFEPTTEDNGRVLADFIPNKMGDADKKIGVMYLNLGAYAAGKNAFVAAAKTRGLNVVATEAVEPSQASFTPQLLRLRNAGVEHLVMIVTIEAVAVLRDAKALGYQPRFSGFYWMFDFIAQAAGPTANGAQGLKLTAPTDTQAFSQFQAKAQQAGKSSEMESFLFYGDSLLLGRVLDAAGPSPSRASLLAGMESIKGYDNGILPPITWGPGDHLGTQAAFPVACCGAKNTWKSLGPAADRFDAGGGQRALARPGLHWLSVT